jgi:carbohydrate-binding DOMON domain-containing protein
MSTQYRLVQSGKTASGGCSAGQGSSETVAPRIYFLFFYLLVKESTNNVIQDDRRSNKIRYAILKARC